MLIRPIRRKRRFAIDSVFSIDIGIEDNDLQQTNYDNYFKNGKELRKG